MDDGGPMGDSCRDDTAAATALAFADADGAALDVNEIAPAVITAQDVLFHVSMIRKKYERLVNSRRERGGRGANCPAARRLAIVTGHTHHAD